MVNSFFTFFFSFPFLGGWPVYGKRLAGFVCVAPPFDFGGPAHRGWANRGLEYLVADVGSEGQVSADAVAEPAPDLRCFPAIRTQPAAENVVGKFRQDGVLAHNDEIRIAFARS